MFLRRKWKAKQWNAMDVPNAKDVKKNPLRLAGRGGLLFSAINRAAFASILKILLSFPPLRRVPPASWPDIICAGLLRAFALSPAENSACAIRSLYNASILYMAKLGCSCAGQAFHFLPGATDGIKRNSRFLAAMPPRLLVAHRGAVVRYCLGLRTGPGDIYRLRPVFIPFINGGFAQRRGAVPIVEGLFRAGDISRPPGGAF